MKARLDLGKFPNLVPKRLAGGFLKLATAPPEGGRFASSDFVAVDRRDHLAELSLTALLPALLPFLSGLFLRFWFAVNMLGTGRQRRVLRGRFHTFLGQFSELVGERFGLLSKRFYLIGERFRLMC